MIKIIPKYPHQKQQFNPGRNQELNLPADIFPVHKFNRENPNAPEGKAVPIASIHERIKELLGEGWPRKYAIAKAKEEAEDSMETLELLVLNKFTNRNIKLNPLLKKLRLFLSKFKDIHIYKKFEVKHEKSLDYN